MALIDTNETEPKKAGEETADDILSEARKRYRLCCDADSDNRTAALDDLAFLTGGEAQWDERAVAARKADGRPIITVNSLPTYLHQVTNDQRQNSPAIKVHPVDDGADVETAKVRQGMIRHIEYDSNADVAYDRAVNSAAAIGFGYWRLVTEYENETSFNQKIMYRSIRNALSVKIDPLSTEPDGSDMNYCFIESAMAREEFKRLYPEATANNTALMSDGSQNYSGWLSDSTVLVCEYYRIKKTDDTVVLLSNGESGFKSDLLEMPEGVSIIKERPGTKCKTEWRKITAVDVLEEEEIKCKWIPVFPVYGDEIDIEGKVIRSGIIRNAKGPAQMYNVMITSATEEVSLRSKSPYMMAEGQEEGHEEEFSQANNRAFPYLTYKPVTLDGNLAPPPQRQPMADVPTGMLAMALHASDNVKKTTDLFDASLGAKGTATSGKQEIAQQREGDNANFHYMDGLLRSLRHCGRCIDWMIPHYYDTERSVRILGEDNSADYATINQPNVNREPSEDGAIREVLNDMSGGEYDITVSAGPSYSTLRQEAAEVTGELMAKNPALWGVIGDLYVRSQDWPNAEEMAERIKKTIPPNLLENDDDGDEQPPIMTPRGPLPVAQVPQVLAQLEGELQQCKEALDKAAADKQAADAAKAQESLLKQQQVVADQELAPQRQATEQLKAGADAGAAEAARLSAEADLIRARTEAAILPDKQATEAAQAQRDAATAEAARLQSEREVQTKAEEAANRKIPTIEEIAQLIQTLKPPAPSAMKIIAPSGQVYQVDVGTLQ